ncbi:MAG: glycosyltransferase, partial [Calditrichota bacterium]
MFLTVIIPAWNEAEQISVNLPLLKQRLEQSFAGYDWEVIVCDNNSSDATAEVATEHGAKVLFEPENQISRARNTGAAAAKGEWLLFIDADTLPSADLLGETKEVCLTEEFLGCGSTVNVVGGTLLNKLRMERLNPLFRLLNFCGGAYLLVERDAFESIGGFSIGLYAYEEIDFVMRLKRYARKKGKRFMVLHHYPVVTSGRKGDYKPSSLL